MINYGKQFIDQSDIKAVIKVLNKIIKKQNSKDLFGIIAIGNNSMRKKISLKVKKINKNFKWINVIHPTAVISPSVTIGSW